MTLDEILAALKAEVGDDAAKAKTVANQIHAALPSVGQALINKGAGIGKGEREGEVTQLKADLAVAKSELEEAQTELVELQKKTPDVAAMKQEHADKIRTLKAAHAVEINDGKAKRHAALKRADVAQLEKELIDVGVKPRMAKILAAKEYEDRFRYTDDDTREVLQLGATTAYTPADGQDAIKLLAADAKKTLDPDDLLTNAESGAGQVGGKVWRSADQTIAKAIEANRGDRMYGGL